MKSKKVNLSTERLEAFAAEAPDNLVAVAKVHKNVHPSRGTMIGIAYCGKDVWDEVDRVPKHVAIKMLRQLRNLEQILLERLER